MTTSQIHVMASSGLSGSTKFRHLSDSELLRFLDPIKHRSPVILELCNRIEELQLVNENSTKPIECPVCLAVLVHDSEN